MHPDTRVPAGVLDAREEARICHQQCVDLIKSIRDRETGWKLIVGAGVAVGFVLGAVAEALAEKYLGPRAPR